MSKSHPTWVRGLKHDKMNTLGSIEQSHPTWVRGLKLRLLHKSNFYASRTLHGCVD